MEGNLVDLWQRWAEIEKILIVAFPVIFRNWYFENGLRKAMYTQFVAVDILITMTYMRVKTCLIWQVQGCTFEPLDV